MFKGHNGHVEDQWGKYFGGICICKSWNIYICFSNEIFTIHNVAWMPGWEKELQTGQPCSSVHLFSIQEVLERKVQVLVVCTGHDLHRHVAWTAQFFLDMVLIPLGIFPTVPKIWQVCFRLEVSHLKWVPQRRRIHHTSQAPPSPNSRDASLARTLALISCVWTPWLEQSRLRSLLGEPCSFSECSCTSSC